MRAPRDLRVRLSDGRNLHALSWPGKGTPLVLLHGLLDSAAGWDALCTASPRPCIAFDLGGFGESDLPRWGAYSAYANDVIEGLDALGIDRFVLVGHSLGGGVATAIAERIPERVRALILLAPSGFGRIPAAEAISLPGVRNVVAAVLPRALGNRTILGTAYRAVISNHLDPTDELIRRVTDHAGQLMPGAREATKAVVRGGVSKRAFNRRQIDYAGPVTLVWGDRDRLVPISHMAGVAKAFPHVDARVWRGMGHHPQCERPLELARLIEKTCARLDGAASRAVAA